jgi:hypothetical protein
VGHQSDIIAPNLLAAAIRHHRRATDFCMLHPRGAESGTEPIGLFGRLKVANGDFLLEVQPVRVRAQGRSRAAVRRVEAAMVQI